ncbi:MAG: hypothetical protein J6333_09760 [Planctomycetes bacterium]|nr:hypothetical protein [Planctomycetota bacterium]
MNANGWKWAWVWLALALAADWGLAGEVKPLGQLLGTPVKYDSFDMEKCTVYVNGKESKEDYPQQLMWTPLSNPAGHGAHFGKDNAPGQTCHYRFAFKEEIEVGSVLLNGNGAVSVLKPGVPYPGDLTKDSDWIPADREMPDGTLSRKEGERLDHCLWVLPEVCKTRAIRLSHTTRPVDTDRHGYCGGIAVFRERMLNLAPFASILVNVNQVHTPRVNNMVSDMYSLWENLAMGSHEAKSRPVVSRENPEDLMLVWPEPVKLDSLMAVMCGFGTVELYVYDGPATGHPREAPEKAWKLANTVEGLQVGYPVPMCPAFLPLGKTYQTRAVRLRMVKAGVSFHPHMMGNMAEGRRVFVDDVIACQYLGPKDKAVAPAALTRKQEIKGAVPIKFTLPAPGYVTMVIEKGDGTRVRNLFSETKFPAGENTVYWDATDDVGRDYDAAEHGLYQVPHAPVAPGDYLARGLWHQGVNLVYEFSVYSPGTPPWDTPDHTGAWLSNHTPPWAAAFAPKELSPTGEPVMFLGCLLTEGPDGMAWVDMDMKKKGGMKWIGGAWLAAPNLATDLGPGRNPKAAVYTAAIFRNDQNNKLQEIRVNMMEKESRNVVQVGRFPLGDDLVGDSWLYLSGMAAFDNKLVCALPKHDLLWVIDAAKGEVVSKITVKAPMGAAFDSEGKFYTVSEKKIVRVPLDGKGKATPLSSGHLEEPIQLALDAKGSFYVSDRGQSHQIKVFGRDGKFVRAIGVAGPPRAGKYDENHMNNPKGLAVDDRDRVWVTEDDCVPKRVSVWDAKTGKLLKAVYGPMKYGGGGTFDPRDSSKFYYVEHGTMEFAIDWKKGESRLTNVVYRHDAPGIMEMPGECTGPETAIYHGKQRYFHNSFNNSPVAGGFQAFLFIDRGGIAVPVAGMGSTVSWKLLQTPEYRKIWPDNGAYQNENNWCFFIWNDKNHDGKPQPEEFFLTKTEYFNCTGACVQDDFSICMAKVNGKALRFPVQWDGEYPTYAWDKRVELATVTGSGSTGGEQVLLDAGGEGVTTQGAAPFLRSSICGFKDGKGTWSYPTLWPGLHASHTCPYPSFPGELLGTTRLLGGLVSPKGSQVAPLWCVNGNLGSHYLFTRDGLFVSTLFPDGRVGRNWTMAAEKRGENFNDVSPNGENFWPTISCTAEGQVYVVDRGSVIRVDGLETLRPLKGQKIKLTAADLKKAQEYRAQVEMARRAAAGNETLHAALVSDGAVQIDGKFADWEGMRKVNIDQRGTAAFFNSNNQPFNISGKLAADGKNLYAAWDTADKNLLRNSGENLQALFKTGGCLDLMLATNPQANPKRSAPVAGDLRLLVTRVGKDPAKMATKAFLYRQVAPGSKTKVPFSSPWRTIEFDEVKDVSAEVQFAEDGQGRYEIAVPLAVLGLKPAPGKVFRGDIGVLRGDGTVTTSRVYWSNKSTSITSDVPSEAELAPGFWGNIEFGK